MKLITRILIILGLLPAAARSQSLSALELGNATRSVVAYEALSDTKAGGSAIHLPATTMQMYAGCRITHLGANITNWKSVEELRFFITRSLDAAPLYELTVTPTVTGWNDFALDTPYEPDGGPVYIGYTVKGTGTLSYARTRNGGEEWIDTDGHGQWERYDGDYSAALYATVEAAPGHPLPARNVRLRTALFPHCAVTGEPFAVQATVANLGTDPITSLDATFRIGGRETIASLGGLSIAPGANAALTLTAPAVTEEGEPAVSCTLTAVNGQPDADPSDNSTTETNLVCRRQFTPRKVLAEVFSTERCTGCPDGHKLLDRTLGEDSRFVELGHHAGFYTDRFSLPESTEYEWFYKPSVVYAPALMLDRTNFTARFPSYADAATPMLGVKEAQLNVLPADAAAVPAYFSVGISATAPAGSRTVRIDVGGEPLLPVAATDVRLFVYLTEDSVSTDSQAGAAGTYYHRHVARTSLTPTWGVPVATDAPYAETFSATLPDGWDATRMSVVAFVAAYDAADRNRCTVFNTEEAPLAPLFATAIDRTTAAASQPQRCEGGYMLPVGTRALWLATADGRSVCTGTAPADRLDMSGCPTGVYVLRLATATGTQCHKLLWTR